MQEQALAHIYCHLVVGYHMLQVALDGDGLVLHMFVVSFGVKKQRIAVRLTNVGIVHLHFGRCFIRHTLDVMEHAC